MAEQTPVFDSNLDYSKVFENEYAKKVNLPTTKCLNAFNHPTLRDHIITICEINFPFVDNTKVKALFHDRIKDQFEYKIDSHYMDAAGRFEARRRVKVADNPNLRKDSATSSSLPSDPSSSLWSDDSIYEGGLKESLKRKKSYNQQKVNLRKTQNRRKRK